MPDALAIATDLVAIIVLSYGIYFRRHRRRDMLLAYVALNVGVMAVAMALSSGAVGVGLGLGLFGVLSIIRLRSSEITQEEVAYYFISLAMGLLAGVDLDRVWLSPSLMATMVAVMFVADHPRLLAQYRQQIVTLDAAHTNEAELIRRLEHLLCAEVRHVVVSRLDLVRDTTTVDVRYRLLDPEAPQAHVHTSSFEPQVELDVVERRGTTR
ncbi:MAG TPA: DUF4956 domain-containing protein [Acidimicrobiales bacterium]|nr:DUF4956 domain-containing protein [Acidimicrobiales bacterium]